MNTRKTLYYCDCRKPIPETKFDDRGEKVVYSNELEQKRTAYFAKYGWSIGRDAYLRELLNEAYKEGKSSTPNSTIESKQTEEKPQ